MLIRTYRYLICPYCFHTIYPGDKYDENTGACFTCFSNNIDIKEEKPENEITDDYVEARR
jgi:hypothetical protein